MAVPDKAADLIVKTLGSSPPEALSEALKSPNHPFDRLSTSVSLVYSHQVLVIERMFGLPLVRRSTFCHTQIDINFSFRFRNTP